MREYLHLYHSVFLPLFSRYFYDFVVFIPLLTFISLFLLYHCSLPLSFYLSLSLNSLTLFLMVYVEDGWTPLHAAAHWGERDTARMLMNRGASLEALTCGVSLYK